MEVVRTRVVAPEARVGAEGEREAGGGEGDGKERGCAQRGLGTRARVLGSVGPGVAGTSSRY
jgi:hypothetical protein